MLNKLLKKTIREVIADIKKEDKFFSELGRRDFKNGDIIEIPDGCTLPSDFNFGVMEEEKTKPCVGCGGIFEIEYLKKVEVTLQERSFPSGSMLIYDKKDLLYCKSCKPAYERVVEFRNKKTYFKEVEVDEKGNILPTKRYIKIPKDFYKPFKSTK